MHGLEGIRRMNNDRAQREVHTSRLPPLQAGFTRLVVDVDLRDSDFAAEGFRDELQGDLDWFDIEGTVSIVPPEDV